MDALCLMFSRALDIIEAERFGISDRHSMRIAALCALMGRRQGYDDDALSALAVCALFHDNALTEYDLSERTGGLKKMGLRPHCEYGQRNVAWLPFARDVDGFILYHHETATGAGPFGKREGEFPLEAALIAAADSVDAAHHLQHMSGRNPGALRDAVAAQIGLNSTRYAMEALLDILDADTLESLRDEHIHETVARLLPPWKADVEDASVLRLACFIAHIVDCKSFFTRKHTEQIANRAWLMSEYYGYGNGERVQLYLAAALHDIGKIAVPLDVLEKPGKLDDSEFRTMKAHVRHTIDWLEGIQGLERISSWAGEHHEKLTGSGYPFGKQAPDLDFNSRLIACIDIYQAVCEQRPYHEARNHKDTMRVLWEMAWKGEIDRAIVKDLDEMMYGYSLRYLPPPDQCKDHIPNSFCRT